MRRHHSHFIQMWSFSYSKNFEPIKIVMKSWKLHFTSGTAAFSSLVRSCFVFNSLCATRLCVFGLMFHIFMIYSMKTIRAKRHKIVQHFYCATITEICALRSVCVFILVCDAFDLLNNFSMLNVFRCQSKRAFVPCCFALAFMCACFFLNIVPSHTETGRKIPIESEWKTEIMCKLDFISCFQCFFFL